MNNKVLSALSMARGAGKLKIGFDASVDAILKGAPLVVLSSDASERTKNSIERVCEDAAEIAVLPFTQEEIENVTGRRFAVAAVCDENFARLVEKQLSEATGGLLNDNKI